MKFFLMYDAEFCLGGKVFLIVVFVQFMCMVQKDLVER